MSAQLSTVSPQPAGLVKSPSKSTWTWILGAAAAAAVVAAIAIFAYERFFHHDTGTAKPKGSAAAAADDSKPKHDPTTTVVLPEGKFKQAEIRCEPVRDVEMPREVGVTGRIEADPNRRVDIRPKAAGVVRTVPIQPGTKVKKGEALVVLDSPDVGSARLLVRERQRALATIRVEAAWKADIAANTRSMIEALRKGVGAEALMKQFAGKTLGASQGTLGTALTELEIAAHEQEKQTKLRAEQITGEHLLFVAQHTKEGAQARFDGTLQTVGFQVEQDDRVARQAVRNAEDMVVDAAERLRVLGVAEDIRELLAHPEKASTLPPGTEDVVAYPIVAPIDGTVVSTSAVRSQRVETTNLLFVVADLSKVYAVANVPESDFAALSGLGGGKVRVAATAYPGRTFDSKILYAGAEVDPTTRTVRFVAETENPDDLLKLGMFAQIVLDSAATDKVPTVPAGAILEVDGKPAVFVPAKGERTYVIRPVKLGREALGRQVVAEGLKAGDQVVTHGAFDIKSELILQNETEEE